MIALLYPFFILVLLVCFALAAYKRRYLLSVVFIVLCLLLNYYAKVFAVGFSASCNSIGLKVLTFNINGSEIVADNDIKKVFNLIISQEADVLFLAEDFEPVGEKLNFLLVRHYPYTTYGHKTDWGGHFFYSKYPLGKVNHIDIESNRFSYCFHCNMAYEQDSISFFGCHLASNNYKLNEASIRPEDINGVSSFREYLKNIEMATEQRCEEVEGIMNHPSFNHRSIVFGDFNDVCGSKPLNLLEGTGLKDAWWEKGFGYGATVSHPLLYRIDHIMYREGLRLKSVKIIEAKGLSDHDALMAVFEY